MKRLTMLTLFSLSLAASAANADSIPRYDVEASCNEVASIGGEFSNMTYNGCIQMEQSAYNALKGQWSDIPSNIRNGCDDVATVGGTGSYSTLRGCVQMETSAANNRQSFSFD